MAVSHSQLAQFAALALIKKMNRITESEELNLTHTVSLTLLSVLDMAF